MKKLNITVYVADPDYGSFLSSGSMMGKNPCLEIRNNFWVKNTEIL
jgi:hypothetical protein